MKSDFIIELFELKFMRIYIIIHLTMFSLGLCGQQIYYGDVSQEENLKGKVLSIRQSCSSFLDSSNKANENYLKLFDNEGFYISRYWLKDNAEIDNYDIYYYEDRVRVAKNNYNSSSDIVRRYVYKYQDRLCVYQGAIDENDIPIRWDWFSYDSLNRRVLQESYARVGESDSVKTVRVEYQYEGDSSGLSTVKRFSKDAVLIREVVYKNDTYSNPIDIVTYDGERNMLLHVKHNYVYDAKQNWISSEIFDAAGNLTSLRVRDIVYWP